MAYNNLILQLKQEAIHTRQEQFPANADGNSANAVGIFDTGISAKAGRALSKAGDIFKKLETFQ